MKILSKYKDYYDFLSGVYGVDEKIILDRTKFEMPVYDGVIRFYICGKRIDGYFDSETNKFLFGDDLVEKFQHVTIIRWDEREINELRNGDKDIRVISMVNSNYRAIYMVVDLIVDKAKINEKNNCPIVCGVLDSYYMYPKLADTGIAGVLPPMDIYLMLSEWLAPKDINVNNQTNDEKILSNGFDTKTSFRNIK